MIDQVLTLVATWPLWAQIAAGVLAAKAVLFGMAIVLCMLEAMTK